MQIKRQRLLCLSLALFGAFLRVDVAGAGNTWTIQSTPNPVHPAGSLSGVSCSSATACTAVGSYRYGIHTFTLIERWNGNTWAIQSSANPTGPQDAHLDAVSCPLVTSCTAVGSYEGGGTLAESWNGTSWTVQPTQDVSGFSDTLDAVSCASPLDCEAVGYYIDNSGFDDVLVTLVEHWDGSSWSIQSPADVGVLYGVSCASASACTAVGGDSNAPLVERWNGSAWATQPAPKPTGAGFTDFSGVACASATTCTAVGKYRDTAGSGHDHVFAERWNGTAWALQAVVQPSGAAASGFSGVSCASASDCTAVGCQSLDSCVTVKSTTLAEHWNGTKWAIQTTQNPAGTRLQLSGVSCPSAPSTSACHAVAGFANQYGADVTLGERWDGSAWTVESTPNRSVATDAFAAVACPTTSACTAVGVNGEGLLATRTLAEAWDGTNWTIQAIPNPGGALENFLFGVACSSATACTAVGAYAANIGNGELTLAERWNGSRWAVQTTPNPAGGHIVTLEAVSCPLTYACVAVGQSSDGNKTLTLIERWNGSSWTIQQSPSPAPDNFLNAVSCATSTSCAAVGYDYQGSTGSYLPLVEHWNGSQWSIQSAPNPSSAFRTVLASVACPSATVCTAVGNYSNHNGDSVPLAERLSGGHWTIQATPAPMGATSSYLTSVSCPSATACTAIGGYQDSSGQTKILTERWNGTSWTLQSTVNPASGTVSLSSMACPSTSQCAAVGAKFDSYANATTLAERE